jgi:hypothetical protein
MELSYYLFAGSLSGLISILGHSVIISVIELASGRKSGTHELQVSVLEAFLHMAFGIVLGLVFWLSWGLTAIVQVPWWIRGGAFGGLAALALVPALVNVGLSTRSSMRDLGVIALRWLTTCLVVGLICAWTWQRGG